MQGKRAVIFANGDQLNIDAVRKQIEPGDYRIAADGGLRHLHSLGLVPDRVVGDLDSISAGEIAALEQQSIRIDRYSPEKDETDLEIALKTAVREGFTNILVLGALGGRVDMTLANVFLLLLPELVGVDARLDDGEEEVTIIRPGSGENAGRVIVGQPGERVSLLAWGGPAKGVCTSGLYYPLYHETLLPEYSRGISNHLIEPRARVTLESGLLICIRARQIVSGYYPDLSIGE
jgi:thiamine pyrophosphokinase